MPVSLIPLILPPQSATVVLESLLHLMRAITFSRLLRSIRKTLSGFIRVLNLVLGKSICILMNLLIEIYMLLPLIQHLQDPYLVKFLPALLVYLCWLLQLLQYIILLIP